MDVDEPEEILEEVEDPMQTMLRRAREAKTQHASASAARKTQSSMPLPSANTTRNRSPSEEMEAVETIRPTKKTKKEMEVAKGKKATDAQPDQDPRFLTAITKARKTRNAMDQLDKEFNDLRIPKLKEKDVVPARAMAYDHPDWNLVDDFDDELRGNFIQIVKKDLYRRDLGRKDAVRVEDGRPNFKKFKKVCHVTWCLRRSQRADGTEKYR